MQPAMQFVTQIGLQYTSLHLKIEETLSSMDWLDWLLLKLNQDLKLLDLKLDLLQWGSEDLLLEVSL